MAHRRSSLKPAKLFSISPVSVFTFSAVVVFLLFMCFGTDDEILKRARSSFRLRQLQQRVENPSPDVPQTTDLASSNLDTTPALILPESNKIESSVTETTPALVLTESIQREASDEVSPTDLEPSDVEVSPADLEPSDVEVSPADLEASDEVSPADLEPSDVEFSPTDLEPSDVEVSPADLEPSDVEVSPADLEASDEVSPADLEPSDVEVSPADLEASDEVSPADLEPSDAEVSPADLEPSDVEVTSASESRYVEVTPAAELSEVEVTPPNSKSTQDQYCDGRRIFLYKLPVEFNELIGKDCENWTLPYWSMCDDLIGEGFGEPMNLLASDPVAPLLQPPSAWYKTDQFSLEVIFHHRLKTYPCLTEDPEQASMFYAPFYHALDLTRNLYNQNLTLRDHLTERFVAWLRNQRPWQLYHGHRHVLPLGRIVWDFLRLPLSTWGSSLLMHPELFNFTSILIERSPWLGQTVAIPYPTNFHPASEAQLQSWQATVRQANRTQFVSFAGSSRDKNMTEMVRGALFTQCAKSPKCKHLHCTQKLCAENAQNIYQLSLESVFCLQPAGDSPTRKGIFDTLLSGCIPVLFDTRQAVEQYLWHLPGNGSSYSVLMDGHAVTFDDYDVMQHLERIPQAEIERLQESIVQMLPTLLYRNPTLEGEYTSKDAFDVAIDSLFERFERLDGGPGHFPGSGSTS